MARYLDGATDYLDASVSLLSASQGPYLVGGAIKVAALGMSHGHLLRGGDALANWRLALGSTADSLTFHKLGGSGSDPNTVGVGSAIALTDADQNYYLRFAYLYRGQGAEWSKWTGRGENGLARVTKTVISATASFTLPTVSASVTFSPLALPVNCHVAEFYVATGIITDFQLQQLMRGDTADSVLGVGGVQVYWPIRGKMSPETDYRGLPSMLGGSPLTIHGTCEQSAHPNTYAPDVITREPQLHAYALTLYHPDETIRAATADLCEAVDIDTLGAAFPHLITNALDITQSIEDGISTTAPTTAILARESRPAGGVGLCRSYGSAIDELSPVFWYRLGDPALTPSGVANNMLLDSSGNNNHASIVGAPTLGSDALLTKDANTSFANTGSISNYGQVASGATALDLSKAFSVVFWFRPAVTSGSIGFYEKTIAGAAGTQLLLFVSGNTFFARARKGGSNYDATWNPGALNTATEYCIGVSFDGNTLRLFGQGVARGTATPGGQIDNGAGLAYVGRLVDTGYALNGKMSDLAGFDYALTAAQFLRLYTIGSEGPREWRTVPYLLQQYERATHTLVRELTGVVGDYDLAKPLRMTLQLTDRDDAVLDQPLPKTIVNVDEFPTATDLGAAVPMIFGRCWISCPLIAVDVEEDPGGSDFLIGHLQDAAGNANQLYVESVWYDQDSEPGLGRANTWTAAPGTISRQDSDEFNVASNLAAFYPLGTMVRFTVSGGDYIYSWVTNYDTGTNRVRLFHASIAVGFDTASLQIGGDFIVETDRYTSGGRPVMSLRFFGDPSQGVIALVVNASLSNPASVIGELLSNPVAGCDESIENVSFTQAATDYYTAGLGGIEDALPNGAASYAPGGDRQQSPARNLIRELLSLRGAWMNRDENGAWTINVDKAGETAWRTFGYVDGYYNNVKDVAFDRTSPLGEAVSRVNLRYGPSGRAKANGDGGYSFFAAGDYLYSIYGLACDVGTPETVSMPWVVSFVQGKRVASYMGKKRRVEDHEIGPVFGVEGRHVQCGELINFRNGSNGESGVFRVKRLRKMLGEVSVRAVEYDSEIFDYADADIAFEDGVGATTAVDGAARDERAMTAGTGVNYIKNGAFQIEPRSTTLTHNSGGILPGWIVSNAGGGMAVLTVLTVTSDLSTVGGAYLTLTATTATTGSGPAIIANGTLANTTTNKRAMPLKVGELAIVSAYVDTAIGWYFEIVTFDSTGASLRTYTPAIRIDANETNGLGWKRYYAVVRAIDAAAAYATMNIAFLTTATSKTIKLDAVQMERAARGVTRPSNWKPGFENQLILTKTATLAMPGSGTTVATASGFLESGMFLVDVSYKVHPAIGSAASLDIGPTGGTADIYGNNIAVADNTTGTAIVNGNSFTPTPIATANTITVTSTSGAYNGTGSITITLHYFKSQVPTA